MRGEKSSFKARPADEVTGNRGPRLFSLGDGSGE